MIGRYGHPPNPLLLLRPHLASFLRRLPPLRHCSLAYGLELVADPRHRRDLCLPPMPRPAKIRKKHENVFDQLIKAIKAPVDFDLPPVLKEWKSNYYVPIKRRCCSLVVRRPVNTEKCGNGVVAEEDIKKGEFVIEYVGEVIDDRTCEQRLWKMKRQGDTNFYLCEVSSNMVIDATNKGNMSRFINHSCEPNTEMQKWTVEGETRVGIFALRDIKTGEELTYDYKFVQFGADQDCHCGSSNCRKMLGITKPVNSIVLHNGNLSQDQHVRKKRKTYLENCIGEIVRLWHRRHSMYLAASIYDFNERNGIHTLLFTDATIEEFDLTEEDWDFLPDPDGPEEVFVSIELCLY
uniref:Histone-lysine N-methyltransferase n=1 Tax=Oryza glumipatula TaxID=40148 RepID=A0A0E0B160_9ORYZ